MNKSNRAAKLAMASSFLCLMLASYAADATSERIVSINGSRVLVACDSQLNVFGGFSKPMEWTGFAERDLLLFDISDDVRYVFRDGKIVQKRLVSQETAYQIIHISDCEADDKYVLIGKDGDVKRRWTGQLSVDELFQTIDAMPMRQYEMRIRNGN